MSHTEKKKLCWNCEGNVLRSTTNCPYCGVYLHPEEEEESYTRSKKRLEPPYKAPPVSQKESPIPESPYSGHLAQSAVYEETEQDSDKPLQAGDWKVVIFPLLFLLSGSLFFLFGFLMLLFSNNGLFTLQWNANYWVIYLILSIPLLYFGWRTLENICED